MSTEPKHTGQMTQKKLISMHRRQFLWFVCAIVGIAVLPGCQAIRDTSTGGPRVTPALVARVVTSQSYIGSPEYKSVVNAGDKAIPLLFDDVQARKWADESYTIDIIVLDMLIHKTADPNVPYVRKVLSTASRSDDVRATAARILGGCSHYITYESTDRLLAKYTVGDRSARVRKACVDGLGQYVVFGVRADKWKISGMVIDALSSGLRDNEASVRLQTVESVAFIASVAMSHDGVRLPWCQRLLVEGRSDKALAVRKAAVEGLMRVDQNELNRKRLRG